jgi:hypothetical protein
MSRVRWHALRCGEIKSQDKGGGALESQINFIVAFPNEIG